jgi:GGDEF domain-containing protein
LGDLDRLHDLQQVTADCYALAIRTAAQYAVEVDAKSARDFRANLEALAEQLCRADSPEPVRAVQSTLRDELRGYRDRAREQLELLRKEVANAAVVMELLADKVTANGEDHATRVQEDLNLLQDAARGQDLIGLRHTVDKAVAGIAQSVEEIKYANQLMAVQLHDEIRMLHRELDDRERALHTDSATGVWNRTKVESCMEDLLQRDDAFCLVLVRVRNLRRAEQQHSCTVVAKALRALVDRFRGASGATPFIGRWSDDQFVAILQDVESAEMTALSSAIARKLDGVYAVQENGQVQNVRLQVTGGVIDQPLGAGVETFRKKLEQLSGVLTGA